MNSKERKEVPWLPGFYFIPNFTKYCLDINGVLKNAATGKVISWIISKSQETKNIKGGYCVTGIQSDSGKRKGVSRHRLMAVLFIPCPGDISDFTVNHINGIPGDDRLENLEWLTQGDNNQHAYDNGLRPNSTVPIILRMWKLKEEHKYPSIASCCKHLNLSHAFITSRLTREPGLAYEDGLQFKYDDDKPWIDPKIRIGKIRVNVECVGKCCNTGKYYIHDSARLLGKTLNINPDKIIQRIRDKSDEPLKGYLFRKFIPGISWDKLHEHY